MKLFASVLQAAGLAASSAAVGFVDWRAGTFVAGLSAVLVGIALERR